jgi:hypothetical protein
MLWIAIVIGGVVLIAWLLDSMKPGRSYLPPGEFYGATQFTEEDMSPIIALLMFDDFMEDGDLDEF